MKGWRCSLAVVLAACGGSSVPAPPTPPPTSEVKITPRTPSLLDAALEKVQLRPIEWVRPPTPEQGVSSVDLTAFAEEVRHAALQTLANNAKPGDVTVMVMCTPDAQQLSPFGATIDPTAMDAFRARLATVSRLRVRSGFVTFRVRLAIQPW